MNPLVSIIIPTFNRADLIAETLDSVREQTYQEWECLVIDDGSTDATEAVLKQYINKDQRFQYHKRPISFGKGANGCRNYGFSLSKGQFINWLDSDDLFSEDKLQAQISEIQQTEQTAKLVVSCKWNRFTTDIDGIFPKEAHINRSFSSGLELLKTFNKYASFFPSHAYLVSRELVAMSKGWDESLRVNQDGEFFTRILLQASRVLHPEKGMVYYRTPQLTGVSQFQDETKIRSAIQSWQLISEHLQDEASLDQFPFIDHAKNYLFERIDDRKTWRKYPKFFEHQLRRARFTYQWKYRILAYFKKK